VVGVEGDSAKVASNGSGLLSVRRGGVPWGESLAMP
jgi:hypothetical protein